MNTLEKTYYHTKTILTHKKEVAKICFKFGLYWQGIIHDFSKFSPTEFISSVRYYQGNRSPIEAEKEDKGFSMAWLHHKSRNKHHFWYWVDYNSKQVQTPVRIPLKYVYELFADTVAAGRVYSKNSGKNWKQSDPYEYYKTHNRNAKNGIEFMEYCTKAVLDNMYVDMMNYGLSYVVESVKNKKYEKFYNNKKTNDGKEILEWNSDYRNLVEKYYTNSEENDYGEKRS